MLSGFTSQIGTFISKKTGSAATTEATPSSEQSPQPTSETTTTPIDLKDNASQEQQTGASPAAGTETSNPANILSSVRNHMPSFPSWLSKKPEAETDPNAAAAAAPTTSTTQNPEEELASATDPQQVGSEEDAAAVAGGPGNMEKIKSLGTSIFSTLKGAGQKIKETSILGEFQREHDSFLKSKGKSSDSALAPWVGHAKEDALKEEILSLSSDRRNFVRCPPPGISFSWDWEEYSPVAKAILKDDPNLEAMRYQLVPKVITEENFWRNYFYRVQLLKESMDDSKPKARRGSSSEEDDGGADDADLEKELNEELKSYEFVAGDSKHDDKEIDSLLDLK